MALYDLNASAAVLLTQLRNQLAIMEALEVLLSTSPRVYLQAVRREELRHRKDVTRALIGTTEK